MEMFLLAEIFVICKPRIAGSWRQALRVGVFVSPTSHVYSHHEFSTSIQKDRKFPQFAVDRLVKSVKKVRSGYHIKVAKFPWSRAQLPD